MYRNSVCNTLKADCIGPTNGASETASFLSKNAGFEPYDIKGGPDLKLMPK